MPGRYSINVSEMNNYVQDTGLCTDYSFRFSLLSIVNLDILQNLGGLKKTVSWSWFGRGEFKLEREISATFNLSNPKIIF